MSYSTYGSNYSTYSNDCGSLIAIIIFGSVILFLLVIILICICWICCRREHRRDGVIVRPIGHMQTGTVLYMNNDQVQFNQSQHRSQNVHQAHIQPPLTPSHGRNVQQCTATAPSSSPAVVSAAEYNNLAPHTTRLTVE